MKYYIYNTQGSNGIRIIVDNLISAFRDKGIDLIEITTLEKCNSDDCIIPMCLKECLEVSQKGYQTKFGLLMDAISLGYINKIKFYLKHFHILNYDFFYSIYGYLRYKHQERKVVSSFESLMLVSQTDINYLESTFTSNCKFVHIENGAFFDTIKAKEPHANLRLGILSPWGAVQVFEENNWFIQSYLKRLVKDFPNITLVLAGRGAYINKFRNRANIEVLGEVENLNDFFASIDIFLTTNPKGCGVLNRVIDAFVHKVPVLGVPQSFSGFLPENEMFFSFTSYRTLKNQMSNILRNPKHSELISSNAYKYAVAHNNWEKNYKKLTEYIIAVYHD